MKGITIYQEPEMEVTLLDIDDVVCLSIDETTPDGGKLPLATDTTTLTVE